MSWKALLGYRAGNTRDDVKRRWRDLIKREHQDRGGSKERAAQLILAWRNADEYFRLVAPRAQVRPGPARRTSTYRDDPMDWEPTPMDWEPTPPPPQRAPTYTKRRGRIFTARPPPVRTTWASGVDKRRTAKRAGVKPTRSVPSAWTSTWSEMYDNYPAVRSVPMRGAYDAAAEAYSRVRLRARKR
jgi:hypothetical protein